MWKESHWFNRWHYYSALTHFSFVRRNKESAGRAHQWHQRQCECGAHEAEKWVKLSSVRIDSEPALRCCLLFCNTETLFQQPWSKVCPKTTQQTGAPSTSGFRKHRSATLAHFLPLIHHHHHHHLSCILQNEDGSCRFSMNELCPSVERQTACLLTHFSAFCACHFVLSTPFCPGSLWKSWHSTMRRKWPFGKEAKEGYRDSWR